MDSDAKELADYMLAVFAPISAVVAFAVAGPAAAVLAALVAIVFAKSVGMLLANHLESQRARIAEQRRLLALARAIERDQAADETTPEEQVAELKKSASVSPARFPLAS